MIQNSLCFVASGLVFVGCELWFRQKAIPYPAWPYGLALSGFAFSFLKTVFCVIEIQKRKESPCSEDCE